MTPLFELHAIKEKKKDSRKRKKTKPLKKFRTISLAKKKIFFKEKNAT